MRVEEKYMKTCTQDHIYFIGLSGTTPIYHVAILQKSSAYFCRSEIEKKKFTTKLTKDTVNSDFPILLMVPLI